MFKASFVQTGCIVEYEKNPIGTALEHVYSLAENDENIDFRKQLAHALQVVEECFDKYKYVTYFTAS